MRTAWFGACVAFLTGAAGAQTRSLLMVARGPVLTPVPDPRAVMLFDAWDGSLVDPEFIPGLGALYEMDFPKDVLQVGAEIWVSDQTESVILRFDLLGNFVGSVHGNMDNIRGMELHGGVVYVTNGTAAGSTPQHALVMFSPTGVHIGSFPVEPNPFDVLAYNGQLLVSHGIGVNDITRWSLSGAPLGVFHTGAITSVSQLTRRGSNGNVLAAGWSHPSGLYEYGPGGNQVNLYGGVSGVRAGHELGNGTLLVSSASGVHVHDPVSHVTTLITDAPGHFMNLLTLNPSATGACCLPAGFCRILTMGQCGTAGGVFRGPGTACTGAACPQPGACCLPGGVCVSAQPQACADLAGVWYGEGSSCAAGACLSFLRATGAPTSTFVEFHGSGVFLDLTGTATVEVRRIDYFPVPGNGVPVTVDVYTRAGSYAGFTGSAAGWTHTHTARGTSAGGATNATRLVLDPPIEIPAGQTVGVHLVGVAGGVRFRDSATAVSNGDLSLFSDVVRSLPFGGTPIPDRGFAGSVFYSTPSTCYADCNGSGALTIGDFACFQSRFASGHPYADCNHSGALTIGDFACFQARFVAACP